MMIGLRVDIMFILWMLFLIVLSELSLQQYYTFAFTACTQLSTRHINDINCNINNDQDDNIIYTTAVIKCAYDGTFFRGWTAGNSETKVKDNKAKSNTNKHNKSTQQQPNRRQSRRSRTLQRKGGSYGYNKGRIRTVDDTIRMALAKVYGDVNPKQIKIEACSRTDAGVHAESLVAQFYCIKNDKNATQSTSIQRPKSYNDTDYLPLPFDSSLSKLVYVLNRMLPPDVRIVGAAPLPHVSSSVPIRGISANLPSSNEKSDTGIAFHPTLHTISKTYKYQFAIGPVHDPIKQNYLWHLDGSSSRAVGMNGNKFCLERALAAANLFVDSNDENINIDTAIERDYGAFRAAFRGTDRGRVQSTICKLWRCDILEERKEVLPSWEVEASSDDKLEEGNERNRRYGSRLGQFTLGPNDNINPQTYTVVITGNRFLYKMMRNIVGTIVAVGCGHIELDDVITALETGKWGSSDESEHNHIRRICGPSRGLTLIDVQYHPDIIFDWLTG